MHYDQRRGAFILQQRTFWTGLTLILCLVAVGLELSFRVPLATGPTQIGLAMAVAALVLMVLKINFTILLSIQVELYPEDRKLLLKSLFNQQDVAKDVRSVEIIYPGQGGLANLAIVAETERYELYQWVCTEEANRIYECYGRQIARTLRLPPKLIQSGGGRQVTQPSALSFRSFLSQGSDSSLFKAAYDRLVQTTVAGVQTPDEKTLSVRWTPTRRVGRFSWACGGAMICLMVALTLAGTFAYLLTPTGYTAVITVVSLWIYWGSFIYFASTEFILVNREITYRMANPLLRALYLPFTTRPFTGSIDDLADTWVAGEAPMERVYLEFRRELLSIETDPMDGKDLIGALLHKITS